jgi:hypothetical protein
MRLILIIATLALAGCTTTRFVKIPCVAKDQVLPAEPERVGSKLTGQAQQAFKIAAGSAVELRAWGRGLNDILEGCRATGEARP